MSELLFLLIPILIVDIMNPVLFAALIYFLGTDRPYWYSGVMLFGYFWVYLIAGIIFTLGLDTLLDLLKYPTPIDYIIQLVIGALLVYFAYYLCFPTHPKPEEKFKKPSKISTLFTFIIGAQVNLIGLPFALPYFAAIDQMLKAQLSPTLFVMVLVYYNILYILPFAICIVIRGIYHKASELFFTRVNYWMHKIGAFVIPILLGLLGVILIADSIGYFFGYPLIIFNKTSELVKSLVI